MVHRAIITVTAPTATAPAAGGFLVAVAIGSPKVWLDRPPVAGQSRSGSGTDEASVLAATGSRLLAGKRTLNPWRRGFPPPIQP